MKPLRDVECCAGGAVVVSTARDTALRPKMTGNGRNNDRGGKAIGTWFVADWPNHTPY